MMYAIEKAKLIAEQLKRFTTGYTHYISGLFENIDFWIDEVLGAIYTIDKHKTRFDQMCSAQQLWIKNHGTVVSDNCEVCRGICELNNGLPKTPIAP